MNKKQPTLEELAKQCLEDSVRWFGDTDTIYSIPYYTLAMLGEGGEFANLVKKIERGSLNFGDAKVRYELSMELTDVLIYLLNIAALMRTDLFAAYLHKRAYNEKRFIAEREKRDVERAGTD